MNIKMSFRKLHNAHSQYVPLQWTSHKPTSDRVDAYKAVLNAHGLAASDFRQLFFANHFVPTKHLDGQARIVPQYT